jgi:hypothetical protein
MYIEIATKLEKSFPNGFQLGEIIETTLYKGMSRSGLRGYGSMNLKPLQDGRWRDVVF